MTSMDIHLGRKFDDNHQLAVLMDRYLGHDEAKRTCSSLGWVSILDALDEQEQIVTRPAE